MRKTEITKIEEVLEKEADKLYRKIKGQCKTYGELKNKINARLREEKWNGSDIGKIVLEKVMRKYEEEISKIKTFPAKGSED